MPWEAELKLKSGKKSDLLYLFEDLPGAEVFLENESVYLRSESWEKITNADKIRGVINRVLRIINDTAQHIDNVDFRVYLGKVFQINEDGERVTEVPDRPPAPPTLLRATEVQPEPHREVLWKLRGVALLAMQDSTMAQIITFTQMELNPLLMYHVKEGIMQDVGGRDPIIEYGWTTSGQLKKFGKAVHSRKVFGNKARHYYGNGANDIPPRKCMTRREAEEFVRGLADQWLEYKMHNLGSTG